MDKNSILKPAEKEILEARRRIKPFIHRTPILTNETLNKITGASLFFKCENFQKVGAFKFRGASNAVFSLSQGEAEKGVATHSSGNHAQALALSAKMRGVPAYIVMPETAPRVKVEAVRGYGARIIFCKPTLKDREETLAEVVKNTGAEFVHPYDDLRVIAGQASCAAEILEDLPDLDLILCPVGGGGLLSGTALSAYYFGKGVKVIAAEPEKADDSYRSFKSKTFFPSENPKTIADGLLTSLGKITMPIVFNYVEDIILAGEERIVRAMKLVWERMKIVIEPSAAVPLAALLEERLDIKGKRIGIILSGGNIDLEKLPWYS